MSTPSEGSYELISSTPFRLLSRHATPRQLGISLGAVDYTLRLSRVAHECIQDQLPHITKKLLEEYDPQDEAESSAVPISNAELVIIFLGHLVDTF